MDTLPICKALSKQSGQRCKNYSMKGKRVCRFHGGLSTGARTAAGRKRQKNASWKHGLRSKEAIQELKQISSFVRNCRELIHENH